MSDLLEQLARLDATMTKGPWRAYSPRVTWRIVSGENYVMESGCSGGVRVEADAEGIAALRNLLPQIIEALKERDVRSTPC